MERTNIDLGKARKSAQAKVPPAITYCQESGNDSPDACHDSSGEEPSKLL
jgi:hypothetical protein